MSKDVLMWREQACHFRVERIYVNGSTDEIVGFVSRSISGYTREEFGPWTAWYGQHVVGDFVTEEGARKAVERAAM